LAQNDKLIGLIYVNMAAGQEKFVSFRSKVMKLKLTMALSAACLFFSIAGAEAVTLSGSNETPAIQSEAVKVGCVGGRRCSAYHLVSGRRVCRTWVACR
jgi:hypothetical protein